MVRATVGLALTVATTGTSSTPVTSLAVSARPCSMTRITPSGGPPGAVRRLARAT